MKLAIPKERHERETRVACSPETVKKFAALSAEVVVEKGAGRHARITDEAYKEAGATVESDLSKVIGGADAVLKVRRPEKEELEHFKKGAVLVGMLEPHGDKENAEDYARRGIDAFAMEFMPRISRAQSMDVLSSQSNLAGYKAVVDAAAELNRAMPMMMTAAGTIPPARVFVLGAGVAGLQAIATARRLGAIVSATDVRPAVKEQVESLGANFVMVESEETKDAETKAGYAKEMSEEFKRKQAQLIADTIAKQDIVITTALIPGKPAPVLITQEMVERMKPGAIIVDLAVEQGGNCPLSKPDEIVDHNGVSIMGHLNLAGHLPVDASALYARNLFNFLSPFINKESGNLELDWEDAVVEGTALTRNGEVVHPSLTGETN
ncbi:MAG: Re/Si-specific NAD(P)(+) transhydrogenase subunit alpha [Gammaproteobacteria bacterium]|nr:Re/Si-specific NAD(P)(+) transhydrogenase subunit alpha [Gammaproteobacteria bacterium]MDH3413275.1 Re/Si-specific NAD(P)(+) transhydrogenase subunit alpha [Gammaproteobacteria bacterium]